MSHSASASLRERSPILSRGGNARGLGPVRDSPSICSGLPSPTDPLLNQRMNLTRRRCDEARDDCWLIYHGDVQVGAIKLCTGNPWNTPSWEWRCGFYTGSNPGESTSGTAATFDMARVDFGRASEAFLSKRT